MTSFNKRLAIVGKRDAFGLDVSEWLDGEAITSATVTNTDGLVTVASTLTEGTLIIGLLDGVAVGYAHVCFEWSTATRTCKEEMIVEVTEVC